MAGDREQLNRLEERILALDHVLRGNGQPGILTRLAVIDERVNALTSFADEINHFRRWVVVGVITLVASMVAQTLGFL